MARLGVNIDHIATLRQLRGTPYPDVIAAAHAAVQGGADQITVHLREDRRHIQDEDLARLKDALSCPLNLEMAAVAEITKAACRLKPHMVTLVPERRAELTTEGGLDLEARMPITRTMAQLDDAGIRVSLFIDPEVQAVERAQALGAAIVELHTGSYCAARDAASADRELTRIASAVAAAVQRGMTVAAGHGLHYENTARLVHALHDIVEYNIGHAIVARAVFVGIEQAVREMKKLIGG